jgi:hypothetical protein
LGSDCNYPPLEYPRQIKALQRQTSLTFPDGAAPLALIGGAIERVTVATADRENDDHLSVARPVEETVADLAQLDFVQIFLAEKPC